MNTCRYKSACKFCSTYLVCIESFDLCCNGIKIPTDIVGEKAGYKDRKMGVSEKDSGLRLQEWQSQEVRVRDGKEKGHWGMCQLFDLCSEGEEWRHRDRRRDMETDRVNLCGTEPGPVTHTHGWQKIYIDWWESTPKQTWQNTEAKVDVDTVIVRCINANTSTTDWMQITH